jgi:hypothetical protein
MQPNDPFIGRRVSVGFGIESVSGTGVAPAAWFKHLSLDFQRRTTVIQNDSAIGRQEKNNDSAIVGKYADGKFEGKVGDITIGYLLYNIFGDLATTTNADASGNVKDHTFNVSQTKVSPSLTVARVDPKTSRRHALAMIAELEIAFETGGWVKVNGSLSAKVGTTSSETVAFAAENEFTSKHIISKLAANVSGIGAATALETKSGKITIKRDVTAFIPQGTDEPVSFDIGPTDFTGELVLRYLNTTQEDLWFANTVQALKIAISNTDVTIGTSAHPGLAFTAPRVRLSSFGMSNDLDSIVEQTVGISGELDMTAGYMLRAVLTNLQTSY